MVHPFAINEMYADLAVSDQVEVLALVPPDSVSVIPDRPLVFSETRMFSMDWAVRAQFWKAPLKAVAFKVPVVLNIFAGNDASLVQLNQACKKSVPELKTRDGKEVRLEQPYQVCKNLVPAAVLINGNEVRPEQFPQEK